jgi:uncharacterized membrane protein
MPIETLNTLVVGYDDVTQAIRDYDDLAKARQEGRVDAYEAAVVQGEHDNRWITATTVDARQRGTLAGTGLGFAVGAVISPLLAGALLGAGFGALFGHVADQIDAFNQAVEMREVEQLVDDSQANMIVIADDETIEVIRAAALERQRRVLVRFSEADIDLLRRELQQNSSWGQV